MVVVVALSLPSSFSDEGAIAAVSEAGVVVVDGEDVDPDKEKTTNDQGKGISNLLTT